MIPNIKLRQCDLNREGRKQLYNPDIFQERFRRIEHLFAWEDKFKRLLLRFEHKIALVHQCRVASKAKIS